MHLIIPILAVVLNLTPAKRDSLKAVGLRLAVNLSPNLRTLSSVEPATGKSRLMRLSGYGNFRLDLP